MKRTDFNKRIWFSAAEATPRNKLFFETSGEISSSNLHELFMKLLSLLPEEKFGSCKLSYGNPKRSMIFGHRDNWKYFKHVYIILCNNFPLNTHQIDFWISKEKIERAYILVEMDKEEDVDENLDTALYMLEKCLMKNIEQYIEFSNEKSKVS